MFEEVGHRVLRLVRTRLGPLALGDLGPGDHRPLTPDELESLRAAVEGGKKEARRRGGATP